MFISPKYKVICNEELRNVESMIDRSDPRIVILTI